ncbi:hypothetical protein NE865_05679 [Phthorimaea operculella]|nr:hypothetical protein NE865_05679 [Phthorimaea operculella]
MTSEVDALKTNEILRLRKLRIQQVREQSKDIAKQIRQRACAEKFKHLLNVDTNKEKEYLEQQDKFIKKLEELHAKSIGNLGASHKNAAEVTQQENKQEKIDLSKQRAREAAIELRRQKQEKLDERKKLLDRKLQAREAANELSREKSAVAVNKSKSSLKSAEESQKSDKQQVVTEQASTSKLPDEEQVQEEVVTNDMATQWSPDPMPNEWEPVIPTLSLPKDDKEPSVKTPENPSKRSNLFALSDEMPMSLRGGQTNEPVDNASIFKPSLIVSDYIQNRDLRLREFDSKPSSKRSTGDLHKIKQTILRTRSAKAEGSVLNPVQVADGQVVPVPSWQAETNCDSCCNDFIHPSQVINQISNNHHEHCIQSSQYKTISNSQINSFFSSIRYNKLDWSARHKPELQPTPVLRGTSPFKRSKVSTGAFPPKPSKVDRSSKEDTLNNIRTLLNNKKSSVTMYNHSTRDLRDVPYGDGSLVSRDHQPDEDAYYQAMRETSSEQVAKEKEHQKKLQDMRHKIAMSRQNVEKEYKNTMEFLKCLSKGSDKPIKSAYKDAQQEQMMKELKQRKLQHEFRKIQRECLKQNTKTPMKSCSKKFVRMKTPENSRDDFDTQDLQYSWMPVPESDRGLAVHIIPTEVKEHKSGNTVKFSKIDSYHEYRSRHKHTPPTKDTCGSERPNVAQPDSADDLDSETSASINVEATSEDLQLEKDSTESDINSDAERIIIYKVLDSKDKKAKVKKKAQKRSISNREEIDRRNAPVVPAQGDEYHQTKPIDDERLGNTATSGPPKHLREGVYKTVQQKGLAYRNITSCYSTNVELWETTCSYHPWWDNMEGARFTDDQKQKSPASEKARNQQNTVDRACGGSREAELGEQSSETTRETPSSTSKSSSNVTKSQSQKQVETNTNATDGPPAGCVKVVDEKGNETGKFFIGATGFLKNDAYEVVIKLKRTDSTKDATKETVPKEMKSESTTTEPVETTRTASSEAKSNKHTNDVGVGEEMINIVDLNSKVSVVSSTHNKFVDRGVDVPFEEPFAYRKESSETKPGTSVSVQTSLHSPEMRYHRMSSSTSTAYLSPPDVILPKYLNSEKYNEKYAYYEQRNPKLYILNHEPQMTPRKPPPKSKSNSPQGKCTQRSKNLTTPPNTARTGFSDYTRTTSNKKRPSPATVPKTVKHKICQKRKVSKTCLKSNTRHIRRTSSTNLAAPPPSLQNTNMQPNVRSSRSHTAAQDVNPIVKWYVDKLLNMNKEGLRAVDVLNQDCSSVTTPGSSIIDDYNNYNRRNMDAKPNISLEQLKELIAKHIMKKYADHPEVLGNQSDKGDTGLKASKSLFRIPKKRSVHKVKSLNISRSFTAKKSSTTEKSKGPSSCPTSVTSSRGDYSKDVATKQKHRSKSSPTPRRADFDPKVKHSNSLESINDKSTNSKNLNKVKPSVPKSLKSVVEMNASPPLVPEPATSSGNTASSDSVQQPFLPLNTATQTSRNIDEDIHYIKMAEDKLQNMEKIADLTEQCTQRLSNLAKVLEEVRKNKLSYSHVSESASDTDPVSRQNSDTKTPVMSYEPIIEIKEKETSSPSPPEPISSPRTPTRSISPIKPSKQVSTKETDDKTKIEEALPTIRAPKPKSPDSIAKTYKLRSPNNVNVSTENNQYTNKLRSPNIVTVCTEHSQFKTRAKPPPALMRRCLKRTQEYVIPHELSTVVEVDSPISTRHKNQSSKHSIKEDETSSSESDKERKSNDDGIAAEKKEDKSHLLQSNNSTSNNQEKASDDTAESSKVQMMDLKKFNDIMLKPFISIQEYAKQCNISKLEEGSNIETLLIGDAINDELSSLHSDALSKIRRSSKKTSGSHADKENVEITSDSLSNSSNPDLENAFKKLGMGWASSTLKKTKEHLALSSSSTNTSSSSLTQFKLKNIRMKEFPALVTDSMSSIRNGTNASSRTDKNAPPKNPTNDNKSAGQQTSLSNSLTVKQFLTNELAKRITFGDNSRKNDTEEEFVSLCETKMPEEMQRATKHGDRSGDSNPRARTSTPVQLYKSMAYNSSTSSNVSNGLFSNADDLSSVKGTSNSMKNQSTSEKDDLTIPNFSLRMRKALSSDCSRSDE